MTAAGSPRARRPLAVGLALFGLFFQLFLPIPLSAASEPGAPNRVLEICAADGIVRVPLPAQDGAAGEADDGAYVEACNHCVLHAAFFFLPVREPETVDRPFAVHERFVLPQSDKYREAAATAAFDARGPPA